MALKKKGSVLSRLSISKKKKFLKVENIEDSEEGMSLGETLNNECTTLLRALSPEVTTDQLIQQIKKREKRREMKKKAREAAILSAEVLGVATTGLMLGPPGILIGLLVFEAIEDYRERKRLEKRKACSSNA
jgi:hypothetical protein